MKIISEFEQDIAIINNEKEDNYDKNDYENESDDDWSDLYDSLGGDEESMYLNLCI